MRTVVRPLLPLALCVLVAVPASAGGSDVATVECGVFRDYTAPDPGADTAGSIAFGVAATPEVIAADATLVPPTESVLPSLQGGAPTALTVVRNGGVITSLAFAPTCAISGTPLLALDLFGPGLHAYVVADRLLVPVEQVESNAGLAALIGTAADTGGTFSVTFHIDLSNGAPTDFSAQTSLVGRVVLLDGGDVRVGAGTLPGSVVDDDARVDLLTAAELGVDATVVVDGVGSIDQSSNGDVVVDITLTVAYAAPPPPSSPLPSPTQAPLPDTAFVNTESQSRGASLGKPPQSARSRRSEP